MTNQNEANKEEEDESPTNLQEFFQHFINIDSAFHYLGLMGLKNILWNLDIYVYLLNLLDFQVKF